MRERLILLIIQVLALSGCQTLRRGDLLFHVVAEGNAITDVTPGMIDHVAICLGGDSVVEALPRKGVTTTPLHEVLSREGGEYVRGRVRGADSRRSLQRAMGYLQRPYDSLYLEGNEAVYCSELVVLSYVDRRGRQLLRQVPMTFRDSMGQIGAYWQQLYGRHQMQVPEGAPGSNPSELSQRREVKMGRIIKKLKKNVRASRI